MEIFADLENEVLPLTQPAPETVVDVILPSYDKPTGGPVRRVSVDEYMATRRGKVG